MRGRRDGPSQMRCWECVLSGQQRVHRMRCRDLAAGTRPDGMLRLPSGELLLSALGNTNRLRARLLRDQWSQRVLRMRVGRVPIVVERNSMRRVRRGRLVRRGRERGDVVRRGHVQRHDGRALAGGLCGVPGRLGVHHGHERAGRVRAGQRGASGERQVRRLRGGQLSACERRVGMRGVSRWELLPRALVRADRVRAGRLLERERPRRVPHMCGG